MRRWLILVLVVMFAGSLFAADKPNIILITIDTLRADHLGCYGAKSNASPHIDQLAAKSVIFENAYSVAPITLTSHTTILSGVYPNKHGVRDNAVFAPAPQPLLQESLKSGGYHTAAFVSGAPLLSRFGLTRGFDLYDDDFAGRERTAEATTQRALQWITQQKSPYFVWIHYYDPHAEYQPPASYRERFRNQLYDGEIAFVDDQIGNLLASIHSNAIILITADHGESLGEHGEKTHAVFLYNATLRVPLILFSPGIKPGRRPEPVSLVDIAPTLREAAGLSAAESDGVSLNKPSADRSLYAESLYAQRNFGFAPLYAEIHSGFKYIQAPHPELYDLGKDPKEQTNLYGKTKTDAWQRDLLQYSKIMNKSEPLSPEDAEKLRSLGYVSGALPAGTIDPKDKISQIEEFNTAMGSLESGKFAEASQQFQRITQADPNSALGFRFLGDSLSAQQRYKEAASAYAASQHLLNDPQSSVPLAKCYAKAGRMDEAEQVLRKAVHDFPEDTSAVFELSSLYSSRNEWEAALNLLNRDAPEFHNQRGIVYLRKKDPGKAVPEFNAATQSGAKAIYWNNLGIAYQQTGAFQNVEQCFKKCRELDPNSQECGANLGFFFVSQKRWQEALPVLNDLAGKNPQLWNVRFALGLTLENLGRKEEAQRIYGALLDEAPADWPGRSELQKRIEP